MAKPPKTLTERIAERARTRTPTRSHRNRAAFLAMRDEVRSALDEGWSIKVVWETLHEENRIGFGYDAFTRYVHKLIYKAPEPATKEPATKPEAGGPTKPAKPNQSAVTAPDGPKVGSSELPSFRHNPNRDPKDVI